MTDYLLRFVFPAAYALLPPAMASERASAHLLAIGGQESGLQHRRQIGGPARGLWQFERIGVRGVLDHHASRAPIAAVCRALLYQPRVEDCYTAIEHNDVLAAAFARCLLWTLPEQLVGRDQAADSWRQYLETWRPGKPRAGEWAAHFERAWQAVSG